MATDLIGFFLISGHDGEVCLVSIKKPIHFDPKKVTDSKHRTDLEKIQEAIKIHDMYLNVHGHEPSSEELIGKVQEFFDYEKQLASIFETTSIDELMKIQTKLDSSPNKQ